MDNQQHQLELQSAIQAFQNNEYAVCQQVLDNLEKSKGISKDILANVHFLKGQLSYTLNDVDQAIEQFNQLIKVKKEHQAYGFLGRIYREQGLYPQSIEAYKNAIKLNPKDQNHYLGLASSYRKIYDNESAVKAYEALIQLQPKNPKAYRNMSLCKTYQSVDDPDRAKIEAFLKDPELSDDNKIQCCFALAKIYNDCDEYDKAFEYTDLGNKIRFGIKAFNIDKHNQKVNSIMYTFRPEFFEQFVNTGSESTKPVFIIGLSRAGKTLIERLINQHPLTQDKEEFAVLNKMVGNVIDQSDFANYDANCLNILTDELLKEMADTYLGKLEKHTDPKVLKITDTTPCNYQYIGYAALLFPKAKVIFCQRHPIDHCMQMYFKYYKKGHYFTNNLDVLAQYYCLYQEMLNYWKKVLPLEILEIKYEDMLNDPQKIQTQLFEFLELPEAEIQNNLEITQKELNRWQHFEKHLKKFKKKLKPLQGGEYEF